MTEATLAQQLAEFTDACRTDGVPAEVATSVGQRVLDILGLGLAAHRLPTSAAAIEYATTQGATNKPPSSAPTGA